MRLSAKFRKEKEESIFVLLHLNARLQPMHRTGIFEEPLAAMMQEYHLGEVTGGSTLQEANGEIKSCDIEMNVRKDVLPRFISYLGKVDMIPRGSWLEVGDAADKIEIGAFQGLGLYLNGTDLPQEVYRSCDVNVLIEELERLLDGIGQRFSHWEGNTETALYFYGRSYEEMRTRIQDFVDSYPLCERCRIVQIA